MRHKAPREQFLQHEAHLVTTESSSSMAEMVFSMTYFSTSLPTPTTRTLTSPVIVCLQRVASTSLMITTLWICTCSQSNCAQEHAPWLSAA